MALALYRKYRPRTFAEVIGQEHVTEPLSAALRSGRLHHAYLFSGPRGCGKTSSARILARSLNCEQGPTPEPCGVCASCKALATDGAGSIDVIEIDAASHGGVDDARELRERAFFAPASSRFKIYVIDEAHMVSSAGFNALLKLVEEPPEYVKFIFATTEPEKVLGTIKSRTHHYPFRLIPPGVLRPYLEQLTAAEGVKVDPAVFPLVVRAGGGSARDTLSVLDQLIAGAGEEGVSYARAVALLGVTDAALLDEMCDALAAGDGAAAYATVDRVAEAGHDPRRFAADLLERLRDLIVLQQVPDAVAKGLIDGPDDQLERMAAQAQRLGPATLSRCADIVHNGLVEMRGTTAPRLLLELICARMLLPGVDDSAGGLLQRLERMERRLAGAELPSAAAGSAPAAAAAPVRPAPAPEAAPAAPARPAPTGPAPAAEAPAQPAPARPAPTEAARPDPVSPEPPRAAPAPPPVPGPGEVGAADIGAVERYWPAIVEQTKHRRVVWSLMQNVTPHALDGNTLVLRANNPGIANRFNDDGLLTVLRDALRAVLKVQWQIRCELAGGPAGPARPAAGPPPARGGGRPQNEPAPANRPPAPAPAQPPAASRAAQTAPTSRAAQPAATESDDSGWPEPARPGGGAPTGGAPTAAAPVDEEWPEPARPGGGAASAPVSAPATGAPAPSAGPAGNGGPAGTGTSVGNATAAGNGTPAGAPVNGGGSAQPGASTVASAARTPAAGSGRTGGNGGAATAVAGNGPAGGGRPVSPALAAARAAAAGRAARTPAGAAPAAAATRVADSDWAGEPPYDPDYDGPVRPGAAPAPAAVTYEGFDPGDEPTDEVIDERTARQTSEQQAVQLLQQALGAERIGETDLT
ncbi:DNA polymerase III subunit gamma and tau [Micromonospora sp. NPDC049559]|uniref:DNA polymerase III subunit gamma and tau n=1 Tax=Micromonospora sp. NPDC049559 TaxID=3155923 RepID=UPI0034278350